MKKLIRNDKNFVLNDFYQELIHFENDQDIYIDKENAWGDLFNKHSTNVQLNTKDAYW